MSSPPPKSLVPAPTVWPPSNPSGTVIPFPLPWGQTGCCPPGGMDALMKCYCDIQQASAFIGQIMLDQINNNPAIIEAIIAGIEKSGSSLPTLGVTNGVAAQPGQVGEWINFSVPSIPYAAGSQISQSVTMGILQPGDWDCFAFGSAGNNPVTAFNFALNPQPPGFSNDMAVGLAVGGAGTTDESTMVATIAQALISVPTLVVFGFQTSGAAAGTGNMTFNARRAR